MLPERVENRRSADDVRPARSRYGREKTTAIGNRTHLVPISPRTTLPVHCGRAFSLILWVFPERVMGLEPTIFCLGSGSFWTKSALYSNLIRAVIRAVRQILRPRGKANMPHEALGKKIWQIRIMPLEQAATQVAASRQHYLAIVPLRDAIL